jgi:large repetitive protein
MKTLSQILGIAILAIGLVACPGDITPPTISLSSSSSNVVAPGSITLIAAATDDLGVTKVEFFDGETKLGEDTTAPFEQPVPLVFENNGTKSYTAKASDAAGNSTTSKPVAVLVKIPDTNGPTVSLSSSASNVTTAGPMTLTAAATDNVGVTKVEFFDGTTKLGEDTTVPFEQIVNLASENSGAKTYTAKAFDAVGNTTSSSPIAVTVNITDITPPTVSISSSSTSVTAVGAITLTANPADNVGVGKVEFFDGTTKLGEDLTAPYEQAVNFTIANNGSKSYTAKAFDTAGNTTSSSSVAVVVNISDTNAPTASLSSNLTNVTTISSITLTATSTDDVGVTKVEFYDGATKLGEDLTTPYEQTVNLTIAGNGSKSYTAKAFDAAGNTTSSSAVLVTVNIPGLGNSPTIAGKIVNWTTTPYNTGTVKFLGADGTPYNLNALLGTSNIDSSGNFSLTLADPPLSGLQTSPAGPIPNCNAGSTAASSNSFSGSPVLGFEVLDNTNQKVGRIGLANSLSTLTGFSNSQIAGTKIGVLFYSTVSVTVSGICINGLGSQTYNITINPGWNYLVQTYTGTNISVYTNGPLPSNVQWYYADNPDITPPTVSLSSSSNIVTTAGAITLTATATDNKTVTKVEFYDGSTKIGEDLTAPYEQIVALVLADNGSKSYTAKAFDAANNSTSSTLVAVTVNIPVLGHAPTIAGQILNWTTTPYGTGSVKFLVNTNPPSPQNFTVGTSNVDLSGNFSTTLTDPPSAALQTINAGAIAYCSAGSSAAYSNSTIGTAAFTEVSDTNSKAVGRIGLTNSLAALTNAPNSQAIGTKIAVLYYSTASTTISGTCFTGITTTLYNVTLDPGWNYLIQSYPSANTISVTNGVLPTDILWYYADLPDTTPPTVNLLSNSNNVTTDGAITLIATATDNVGITKVEFYEGAIKIGEDLTAPFEHSVNLSASDNGSKYYGAKAFDAAGNSAINTTTLVITVNIADIIKPNVSLSSSSNSISMFGPITLFANATDNVGISKVEFYDGATKIGEDLTAPFEEIINFTRADNGSKSYIALAFDAAGNSNSSNLIVVNINMVGLGNNPSISGHIANWTTTSFGTGSNKNLSGTSPLGLPRLRSAKRSILNGNNAKIHVASNGELHPQRLSLGFILESVHLVQ